MRIDRKSRKNAAEISDAPQYKELVADIVALVKTVRGRLAAAGQLDAFDTLAAEGDHQAPRSRKRRTAKKKQPKKGRRK